MPDVRLCAVSDVAANSATRVDVGGYRLTVVRIGPGDAGDEWYVLDDRCSHAEASLAEGEVWAEDREIECPRHGSTFDLTTGRAITLPATRPQETYAVRVEGDDVIAVFPDDGLPDDSLPDDSLPDGGTP